MRKRIFKKINLKWIFGKQGNMINIIVKHVYYDEINKKINDENLINIENQDNEFYVEGIQTTIPLYKTIIDDPAFIIGDLSTDYLDRFKIFDKVHIMAKEYMKKNVDAIVATALLHNVLVKRGIDMQQKTNKRSRWKEKGTFAQGLNYGI